MFPTVTLHIGISVDGRIDYGTGEAGPYYALVDRIEHDADPVQLGIKPAFT